jgi:hypothetical protein
VPDVPLADPTTRLGQLQRGRGDGFVAALAVGVAAHDELLACVCGDPRVEPTMEARARYYAELVVAVQLPCEPLLAHCARGDGAGLADEAVAALWALGEPAARAALADDALDDALLQRLVQRLWAAGWATPADLPGRARAHCLRLAREDADCAAAVVRQDRQTELGRLSVDELLELGRDPRHGRSDRLLGELCARGDEATRARLFAVLSTDLVYGRVRLAARALGLCADDRALPLAEDLFARPDELDDPTRRLDGTTRMRRGCLVDYVAHLPGPHALAQARRWRGWGGYFDVVVGAVYREHATPQDREALEAFLAANDLRSGGLQGIDELDALARIGDPRSAPLLLAVARDAAFSHARRRALHALAMMPDAPGAADALRLALWDCEDETAADACSFLPTLGAVERARVEALAGSPIAAKELRLRAAARLRRRS